MFHHSRRHPFVHVLTLRGHRAVRRIVAGTALVLLGVGCLLRGQGLIASADLWLIAPLAIALSGVVRLVVQPGLASLLRAALRFAVAAYLVVVIEHLGGWTLASTWPVLLIAAGAGQILHALYCHRTREEPNW
jgi:hypothetical protein